MFNKTIKSSSNTYASTEQVITRSTLKVIADSSKGYWHKTLWENVANENMREYYLCLMKQTWFRVRNGNGTKRKPNKRRER